MNIRFATKSNPKKSTSGSLDAYLNKLYEFKILTAEEEAKQFQKLKQGDKLARTKLIQSNLRLVVSIAKRYRGQGLELIDLIQEGNLGLIKAIEKYSVDKGARFSTYASWWIREAITRALSNQSRTIRIPTHMTETFTKIRKAKEIYKAKYHKDPRIADLAKITGIAAKKIELALTVDQKNVSLEAAATENDGTNNGAEIETSGVNIDSKIANEHLLKELNALLEALNQRERDVICLRFEFLGQPSLSLKEIESYLGLSKDQVQKASANAMRKLKELASLESGLSLRDFLK